jgi:hypothetical protein
MGKERNQAEIEAKRIAALKTARAKLEGERRRAGLS